MLSVCFWGVRGTMPCPGPATVQFGGNTSCLEIRADGRLIIIDLGTGIKPLGDALMAADHKKNGCVDADIFITHTHWDHIMGFPVFNPLFAPGSRFRIRGPVSSEGDTLESIIGEQLSYRFWPVRANELSATIEYGQLRETSLDLGGGLSVHTKYLNHSILCLGYRFEYEGKSIVTAYDHEPFRNLFPADPAAPGYDKAAAAEGARAAAEENEKIVRFFKGADILIHDAQYTDAEYAEHIGWGHSSYEQAIGNAAEAGVKKLVFFHHDPNRTDEQLAQYEQNYHSGASGGLQLLMAREGLRIEA